MRPLSSVRRCSAGVTEGCPRQGAVPDAPVGATKDPAPAADSSARGLIPLPQAQRSSRVRI